MMNPWKASTIVLGTALALSFTISAARPAHADPQPKMQSALTQLKAGRESLQDATADKGGHRMKAIQLTNEAIDEVKKGIEADNAK